MPGVIRMIGYSIRHLPRCCDLLWELGRDDDAKVNPHPDRAMKILQNLANYELDKPLAYNQVVLEAVSRWLEAPGAHSHKHSPLDVLDPLFAKTGMSFQGRGHSVVIQSFHCAREPIQPLRDAALKLAEECLGSEKQSVVLRALRSLEEALREPLPYLNTTISVEDRDQWTPDRLRVLGILREFAGRTSSPLIMIPLQDILRSASTYGSSQEVKQEARNILKAIPDSFDLSLTRLLCGNYHDLCFTDERDDEQKMSWQEKQERLNTLSRQVATEFLQRYPKPEHGFKNLNDRFQQIQESGKEVRPWLLMHAIAEADGAYSDKFCELILGAPDCALAGTFGSLVVGMRNRNVAHALTLIRGVVDGGSVVLCRAVANEYWQQDWLENPGDGDLEILERLIHHADFEVKRLATFALQTLGKSQPGTAISLALKLDAQDSEKLADEICLLFSKESGGIDPDLLSDDDVRGILAKLEAIQSIDDHHIQQFLSYASKRDSQAVIQLLLNRIDRQETRQGTSSKVLPFDGFHPPLEGVAETDQYPHSLRGIWDRMLDASGDALFWLPKLFKEVSLNFSPASLQVLSEWIDSGERKKIEAASHILSEADHRFVFEEVAYVSNLLERAVAAGHACYTRVFNHLSNCARSQSREGIAGQPFPQDIALRDQAAAMASKFAPGSPQHRLYDFLRKHADAAIKEEAALDEEEGD